MKKKFNVGITVYIKEPTESLFSNGLKQNAITFLETFSKCKNVDKVYFINLGEQKDLSQSPWKAYSDHIIDFDQALEKIDLAVTVAVTFTDEMLEKLVAKNIKIVKHVLGTEYHLIVESMLFGSKAKAWTSLCVPTSSLGVESATWLPPCQASLPRWLVSRCWLPSWSASGGGGTRRGTPSASSQPLRCLFSGSGLRTV